MNECFLPTSNYRELQELINELMGPALGVEMAAVTGRAGRGKTTAAQRIYAETNRAVYVLYQEAWTINDLFREIAFSLSGIRPFRRQQAMELIQSELGRERRAIMIDEADRAPVKVLNALRNIHDITKSPIVLIGEDELSRKLSAERRISSRIRNAIPFKPLSVQDLTLFYRLSLGITLPASKADKLAAASAGDFRNVLTDALTIERLMKVNSAGEVTDEIVEKAIGRKK